MVLPCLQLIIAANGKNFCGGLDLGYLAATFLQKQDSSSGSSSTSGDHGTSSSCPATRREQFKRDITHMQVRVPHSPPALTLLLARCCDVCLPDATRQPYSWCSSHHQTLGCVHPRTSTLCRRHCCCHGGAHGGQAAYSVLEEVPVPVLAAVQGACVGAGVDLITAADLRFASADAWFCVKVG
jgi:hypothetical protein